MIKTITKDPDSWPPVGEWVVCLMTKAREPEDKKYQEEFGRLVGGKCDFSLWKRTGEKRMFCFETQEVPVDQMVGWKWCTMVDLLPLFTGDKLLVDREDLRWLFSWTRLAIINNGYDETDKRHRCLANSEAKMGKKQALNKLAKLESLLDEV